VDPRKILELIADPQGILFQVELGRVKLMFRTLLGHYDQGKPVIEFQIPDQIYKVQQRKEPRVSTRDIAGLHGSHEDPHLPEKRISRKILDLSEGGVSLKIFVGEDRHYQVGKQFQELQIQLPESFFQCLGQVQNIRLVKLSENESEMVMGIKFVSLSEENRIKIQNFIQSRVMQEFGEMMIPMPSTDNPSPSKI
jgi:c-di-GMP-binding flagellar brake protein YcgR